MLDDLVYDDAVFRVHADEAARRARRLHRAIDRRVVDEKDAGVSHEELEAHHAFVDQLAHLRHALVGQIGGDQVKPVIDGRLAFGLLVPVIDGLDERLAVILHREIYDRSRAAVRRGDRARAEIV